MDGISLNQSTYHALYRESSPTRKEKSGLTDTTSLFRNEAFIQRFILQFRQDYLQGSSEESLYTSLIDFDQVRLFQEGESKEFGQKEYNRIKQVVDSERHYIEGKIDLIDVQLNFWTIMFLISSIWAVITLSMQPSCIFLAGDRRKMSLMRAFKCAMDKRAPSSLHQAIPNGIFSRL